jgi:hypothetical protein
MANEARFERFLETNVLAADRYASTTVPLILWDWAIPAGTSGPGALDRRAGEIASARLICGPTRGLLLLMLMRRKWPLCASADGTVGALRGERVMYASVGEECGPHLVQTPSNTNALSVTSAMTCAVCSARKTSASFLSQARLSLCGYWISSQWIMASSRRTERPVWRKTPRGQLSGGRSRIASSIRPPVPRDSNGGRPPRAHSGFETGPRAALMPLDWPVRPERNAGSIN